MTNEIIPEAMKPIKLDLGCGPNKNGPEWVGVDCMQFDNKVDIIFNLAEIDLTAGTDKYSQFKKWPWDDNTVDEIHCSHFLEHLTGVERVHFMNEVYRILKPGAKCTVVVPHWASNRSYGDVTHQWPPISEMYFYYLSVAWRAVNAPHNNFYKCNFNASWGYSMRQDLVVRTQEYQNFALQNFKEAAQDTIATLIKI